jgi:predicted Fe-Mo cluster-binding NifX family protein
MKIALPTQNNSIDSHFGHCEKYTIYTINDKKEIAAVEELPAPSGCGCKSNIAPILANLGVKVLLAGNMGEGAVNVLKDSGISVVRGCSGDTKQAVLDYLAGKIVDNMVVCREHESDCH